MNTSLGSMDSGGDKRIPETTLVPTFGQNLTTMQNIQSIQTVQQTAQNTLQSIQPSQAVVGSSTGLVGKSVSVELNQKAPIMKTVIPSGSTSPAEGNKLQVITQIASFIIFLIIQIFQIKQLLKNCAEFSKSFVQLYVI